MLANIKINIKAEFMFNEDRHWFHKETTLPRLDQVSTFPYLKPKTQGVKVGGTRFNYFLTKTPVFPPQHKRNDFKPDT